MIDREPPTDVFFNRSCPVCGRKVSIRIQLLGQRVYCQHCGGGFTAVDETIGLGPAVHDRVDDLLERASRMLAETAAGGGDDTAGING